LDQPAIFSLPHFSQAFFLTPYFTTTFETTMAFVAIEFSEDQLLVAIAQKSGLRCRFGDVLNLDISDSTDEEAGESLKEKLSAIASGKGKSEAIAIVSRSMAEIRELTVPPAPDNELPEMIRFQARHEFASLNDQWKLDYATLTDDPAQPRKVLAAAISPELETKIRTICQHSGLKLKRIVLRPFATLDLLNPHLASDGLSLIVDQNADSTDMSIVKANMLYSTRTVRAPKTLTPEQSSKQLITEVRRTVASHKGSSSGDSINNIVVSGREAHHRHLKGDLEGKLGLKVTFLDPFDLVDVENRPGEDNAVNPARFASLLGALETEVAGQPPRLDFANVRKTEEIKTDYSKFYFYGALAAAVALVGMFLGWMILRSQANQIETAQANLVQAIEINQGNGTIPPVEQQLKEVELIDQWKMESVNWLTELSEFSAGYLLPDDVIADAFTASVQRDGTPKIVLRGRIVEELSKTDQLIKALSQRPYKVETIDTGTVAPDQKSDYPSTFEYHLQLPESVQPNLNMLNRQANQFGKSAASNAGSQP
jgi:Tfp pilus assembly PilM family ATPase